jgi:hypothetical protein
MRLCNALRHRGLNQIILYAVAGGWALLLGIVVWLLLPEGGDALAMRGGNPRSVDIINVILVAGLFILGLGSVSLFSLVWGWAGLRAGDAGSRTLNIWQIVAAVPGILLSIGLFYLLFGFS